MELSKEDIVAVGFKEILKGVNNKLVNSSKFIKNMSLGKSYTLMFYYDDALKHTFKGHNIHIKYKSENWSATVFMGSILDKEELVKLMRQLNI